MLGPLHEDGADLVNELQAESLPYKGRTQMPDENACAEVT